MNVKAKLQRSLFGQDEGCYLCKSYSLVCISVFSRRLNPRRWSIIPCPVFGVFLLTTLLPMNQYFRSLLACLFPLSTCLCSLRGDRDKISEHRCERKWLIRWGFAVSRGGGHSLVSTFVISFQPASRWFSVLFFIQTMSSFLKLHPSVYKHRKKCRQLSYHHMICRSSRTSTVQTICSLNYRWIKQRFILFMFLGQLISETRIRKKTSNGW